MTLVLTSSCQLRIKSTDLSMRVQPVFLDICEAFDKGQHVRLILKLKQNVISPNLLSTLTGLLKLRKQRVVLNSQLPSWSSIELDVSQGSIPDPLLFLIYINDLSESLTTNARFFADDV